MPVHLGRRWRRGYRPRMFSREELALPVEELAVVVVERLRGVDPADRRMPEKVRDLALVLELERQVFNGGFAQFFFNSSGGRAVDTWIASRKIDRTAHALLGAAFVRLGTEFGFDLALANLRRLRGDEGLAAAEGYVLGIQRRQRELPDGIVEIFISFAKRLEEPHGAIEGFKTLNESFWEETELYTAMAEHVKATHQAAEIFS